MSENQISDQEAERIANELKTNKEMADEIKKINTPIYENPQLQQRIANNGNKTTLDLSNSKYTDQDMRIVANELKTNKTITWLKLHQNQISDRGAQRLGNALKLNTTLKDLRLYNNQIGDQGAKYLGDALKVNEVSYFFS
jgi:Ran GTPase-activating protein (RanGAP) involved in mRNA processing and transport